MSTLAQRAQAAVAYSDLPDPAACEACGAEQSPTATGRRRVIWHHWSYEPEHWLDVIPLCGSCHRRVHVGTLPEPRTGRIYERPASARRPPWPVDMDAELVRLWESGAPAAEIRDALGYKSAGVVYNRVAFLRGLGVPLRMRHPMGRVDVARLTALVKETP